MSMISVQIDKLRERAKVLRQGRWSDGADDARLMEDAADTIWQLRDDLQRTNAENAKLRELVRTFYHCTTSGECDECPINDGGPVHLMPDTICDTIHDRMRELGIEVDNGAE